MISVSTSPGLHDEARLCKGRVLLEVRQRDDAMISRITRPKVFSKPISE
jgi:hypothetical protein